VSNLENTSQSQKITHLTHACRYICKGACAANSICAFSNPGGSQNPFFLPNFIWHVSYSGHCQRTNLFLTFFFYKKLSNATQRPAVLACRWYASAHGVRRHTCRCHAVANAIWCHIVDATVKKHTGNTDTKRAAARPMYKRLSELREREKEFYAKSLETVHPRTFRCICFVK